MNKNQLQIRAIEEKIILLRGHKVILDSHLAELYGVETRILIRNMKRNLDRFPSDFMLHLTKVELENLRSQIGISGFGYGGRRYLPYAFTENGVAMLSSVLNSKRAIHVNIQIMRAFTKLREWLATHHDLQEKIKKLELREASLAFAKEQGRPITYLSSSQTNKEDVALKIAQKDGITKGLIAVLTCVEP